MEPLLFAQIYTTAPFTNSLQEEVEHAKLTKLRETQTTQQGGAHSDQTIASAVQSWISRRRMDGWMLDCVYIVFLCVVW